MASIFKFHEGIPQFGNPDLGTSKTHGMQDSMNHSNKMISNAYLTF
jgi:hypothetical protein